MTDVRVAGVQKSILTEIVKRRPEFAVKLFSSFSERPTLITYLMRS